MGSSVDSTPVMVCQVSQIQLINKHVIHGHVPAGDKLSSPSPANTGDHGNVPVTQDKLCCISYDKI